MRYTATKQIIEVLGTMWMPMSTAATRMELSEYDMANIENPHNREHVAMWLATHSGDFSRIIDFRADFTIGDESIVHEWSSEDSEATFNDCMRGPDDDE